LGVAKKQFVDFVVKILNVHLDSLVFWDFVVLFEFSSV